MPDSVLLLFHFQSIIIINIIIIIGSLRLWPVLLITHSWAFKQKSPAGVASGNTKTSV